MTALPANAWRNASATFALSTSLTTSPLAPAEFFAELIAALEDDSIDRLEEIGFRGSAKSTFTSMAYVLYAALVKPELYPFIIPIADTGTQATAVVSAIKFELETNELLREDFGTIEVGRLNPQTSRGELKREGLRARRSGRPATCFSPPASASSPVAEASAFAASVTGSIVPSWSLVTT